MPNITFLQYLNSFRSIQGAVAGVLSVSGPALTWLTPVAPPQIEGIEFFVILAAFVSLVLPYVAWRALGFRTRTSYLFGFIAMIVGFVGGILYTFILFPHYTYPIHTEPPDRVVLPAAKYYKESALGYINDKGLVRSKALEHYGTQVEEVFTDRGIIVTLIWLASTYVAIVFLLPLSFCFMVLGEALARSKPSHAHPPSRAPAQPGADRDGD